MHEQIRDIQNTIWKAYTDFYQSGNMRQYNQDLKAVVVKYQSDELLLRFVQHLIITWCPVIDKTKGDIWKKEN